MDTFQENLMNNNFELIATELFNDDPKLQIENLKVSIQTQRLKFANRMNFILDIVECFHAKLISLSTEERCPYYSGDVS